MKIRTAVVDLSALPAWPSRMLATRDVHQASDAFWTLRAVFGASVVPSPFHVLKFGPGLLVIVHVE